MITPHHRKRFDNIFENDSTIGLWHVSELVANEVLQSTYIYPGCRPYLIFETFGCLHLKYPHHMLE